MKYGIKRWWLSIGFLAGYPMIFYLWIWFPGTVAVSIVTCVAVAAGCAGITLARRRDYFINATEAVLYGAVVFDIIAEAICILHPKLGAVHDGHDFWWCALAFAVVMGGYRWWGLRRSDV